MRETRALATLKRLYPKAHFQVIGGCATGGVLDINACLNGVEVWVELKQEETPKTDRGKIKPKVMRGQPAWEILRRQAGGRTFVGLMLDSEFYLLPGSSLLELKSGITLERLEQLKLPTTSLFEVTHGASSPAGHDLQDKAVSTSIRRSPKVQR